MTVTRHSKRIWNILEVLHIAPFEIGKGKIEEQIFKIPTLWLMYLVLPLRQLLLFKLL